jgi:hypothetical protein
MLRHGPAGKEDAGWTCSGAAQLQTEPEPSRDAERARKRSSGRRRPSRDAERAEKQSSGRRRPSRDTEWAEKRSSGCRRPSRDAEWAEKRSSGRRRPSQDAERAGKRSSGRRRPSRGACCLHRPGRPKSARYQLMPARRGRNSPMPAHKREYRPGKNIFRPGKLYAGPGNAGIDTGHTYVGRDMNMPAGT